MEQNSELDYIPLGLHLSNLAKQYIGVVTKKLSSLDIERYYYALMVTGSLKGQVTQQMLCEVLGKDKATMVRIIDYLVKKGCLERVQNEKDRREYLLKVTLKGKKYVPLIRSAMAEANEAVFKSMEQSEICSFFGVLEKISCNLSSYPSDKIDLTFKKLPVKL